MKARKWLLILLAIVTTMSLATYTGVTRSFFTDDEQSTDDALGIRWGLITLNDGFEGTPWDDYWNENGTTTWVQDSANPHSGTYSAYCDKNSLGYLTTDEIDASAADNISVSFWFNLGSLEAGDCLVQTYNGTSYNTWYDLTAYSTYVDSTWCQFNEVITDPQYFIAGFRLRFDTSAILGNEAANIDDVYITTDSIPPAAPTNLAATAGEEEVGLDWDDNSEPDMASYNIYRSLTSGSGYAYVDNSPVSEFLDIGLTNDVTYYYVVTAVDTGDNESANSTEANATPTDLPPAVPTNLSAVAGDRLVDLDWDDNSESDLAGYNIYRSLTSGSDYTYIDNSVTSAYTDTELTGGTTYYYVVTAVDGNPYESGYSDEVSATPSDLPPVSPINLNATPGDKLVDLDWDDNGESDLAGYNIYRSLTSGSGYTYIDNSLTSAYTDTGLTGGTTYYYVVTAVDNESNESDYSNEVNATPTDAPPAAPTNLNATPGDKQVSLDWDDNGEGDLASYNIYRSLTSGEGYAYIDNSVTSAYTDTGLTGGTTYYYVVTAVDGGSNESSNSNEANAAPTDTPPAAPTNLSAIAGERQVSLDWDDNGEEDLASYNIYRSLTSGEGYAYIDSSVTSAYTDTGLTGGTTYYYVVTAVDGGSNESSDSNEANATPTDTPPAAPTNLSAIPGERQVSLDWDDNGESDLASYNIYRSLTSGSPYDYVDNSVTSAYTDTGLTGGTTYYYVVTAVDNGSNESGNSTDGDNS